MSDKVVEKLKKIYEEKGITTCELRLSDCWEDNGLSFAHRHKRIWYKGQEHKLSEFNQTILCCLQCHQKIEYKRSFSEMKFNELRGKE